MAYLLLSVILSVVLGFQAQAQTAGRWPVAQSGVRHLDWVVTSNGRAHFEDCEELECFMLGPSLSSDQVMTFLADFRDRLNETSHVGSTAKARRDPLAGQDATIHSFKRFLIGGVTFGAGWGGSHLVGHTPISMTLALSTSLLAMASYYILSEKPALDANKLAANTLLPLVGELQRQSTDPASEPQPIDLEQRSYHFLLSSLRRMFSRLQF